ncbi:hypothetical protein S245_041535, partial [Arachis hypogaea]
RIMITPKAANTGKGLSIYLDAVYIANAKTRYAGFKLSLINEFCRKKTKTRTSISFLIFFLAMLSNFFFNIKE